MADTAITYQKLIDAHTDADSLRDFTNGAPYTQIKTRLGRYVWTLATFNKIFEEFQTESQDVINQFQDAITTIVQNDGIPAETVIVGDGRLDVVAENLLFNYSVLNKAIKRSLYDKVAETISLRDYGAIGDGTLHTVQEWVDSGVFSNLAAIQVAFPHVTSLTNSIDWAVTQLCINMRKSVYAPSGTYIFAENEKVDTPNSGSPNRVDTNTVLFGDGCKTIFTKLQTGVSTRILKSDGTLDIDATDDLNQYESVFAIHGSYYKFTDFMINQSKVGFYFGQDLRDTSESSACYKNVIRDVQVRRCSQGIIMSAAYGNHYNDISNIHFIECQIDCEMRNGKYSVVAQANNNRNYFTNTRSNRSIVGLWCSSGDTNRFTCWDGEGCGESPTNNPYPTPNGMPKLSDSTQIKTCVHILDGVGQLNKLTNCQMENCEIELYNNNYGGTFIANGYHESTVNSTQVYNLQEPRLWLSHDTIFTPTQASLLNLNTNAFPNIANAGLIFKGSTPRNVTGRLITKTAATDNSYSEKRLFKLGSATANEVKTLAIWGDVDASSSANIKVRVTATSQASNLSFANEIVISANRASTKALNRYFLTEILKIRATSQGGGDNTSTIIPTVAHGGANTRELILSLTMPNYEISSCIVEVELLVSRN